MHSRIFHLEKNRNSFEDYELNEESFYYEGGCEWFLHDIADYIDVETDREDDINWFVNCYKKHSECPDFFRTIEEDGKIVGIIFYPLFKTVYFRDRYSEFKRKTQELTFDQFSDEIDYGIELYRIKMLIEDKFGFYVYMTDYGLITMDQFVRLLDSNEPTTWYFGNTIDYHS